MFSHELSEVTLYVLAGPDIGKHQVVDLSSCDNPSNKILVTRYNKE